MRKSRFDLSVGESIQIDDQILTVIDIHGDEITFPPRLRRRIRFRKRFDPQRTTPPALNVVAFRSAKDDIFRPDSG